MAARFKGWEHVQILDDAGISRDATAPLIISASRSTDIPAFFGDWFMHRLDRGYAAWENPWNRQKHYVSFTRTRALAFWSKNPAPFLKSLPRLDEKNIPYYFQFTLNDYVNEGLEPRIPALSDRVETYIALSKIVGKGRVVWRFDPLILADILTVDDLLSRVERIGARLRHHTRRMVISFVDIAKYPRVHRNLRNERVAGIREFTRDEMHEFCSGLQGLNADWDLSISACGEAEDLSEFGISRGQCISGELLKEEFPDDRMLMEFLGEPEPVHGIGGKNVPFRHLKDPGQRGPCGCIASKDIGQYSTCMHLCRYCYANASARIVERHYRTHLEYKDRGVFPESIAGTREGI